MTLDMQYKDYQWIYLVTSNEYVLFVQTVPFYDLLEFPQFIIPKGPIGLIQVRVMLLDDRGDYVDSSYDVVPPYANTVKGVLNVAPLRMRERFLLSMGAAIN